MKQNQLILLCVFCMMVLLLLPACIPDGLSTATPAEPVLTVTEIQQEYAAYVDQLVSVRGYGIIMMTVPLCPGYVGMDTRMDFVDEEGE